VIQPADPKARRCAILTVVLVGLVAIAVYAVADRWLADVRARAPAEAHQAFIAAIRWGAITVAAMVAAFGLYMFALGRRVAAGRRFPPEGMAVVRDTVVLDGPAARRRGHIIQALAVALVAASAALAFSAFGLTALLEHAAALSGPERAA